MNKEKEIWKDIRGYDGLYQISNHGNQQENILLQNKN